MSLPTVATVAGVLVALVAILGALVRVAAAIWRAAGASHDLVSAVQENTAATATLAAEFRDHRSDVATTLADYGARLVRLEKRR